MILIETTLVLIDALSSGYHSITGRLTFYTFQSVYSIIRRIKAGKYNPQKALGLPDIKTLPLTDHHVI